jgi:hypothetical protein
MKPILIISPTLVKFLSIFIDIYAITLFPFIISKEKMGDVTLRHEKIHLYQQKELFVLLFYILYCYDFLKGLAKYKNIDDAYRQIRFEQEAYDNANDEEYLTHRLKYNWHNYKV